MMSSREDFLELVERVMKIEGRAHMRPVVEKELLHYDILFALDKENLLDRLTFQGGTSLRLCYGSPRFSEDLDFAGGKNFQTADLIAIKNCIEEYIGERYGLAVTVKEPSELANEPRNQGIKVSKWQVSITTFPDKKDLPRQRIKLEIANIPAYSRAPLALQYNYDFLPDGYSDVLIMTETLDEVMADKIISLVDCTRYNRHRDIWDLRWLKQQGATPNSEFIKKKIEDYRISDYSEKLNQRLENIVSIIFSPQFHAEMMRFLPIDVLERTLLKDKFKIHLTAEIQSILLEVKKMISINVDTDEY